MGPGFSDTQQVNDSTRPRTRPPGLRAACCSLVSLRFNLRLELMAWLNQGISGDTRGDHLSPGWYKV